LPTPELGKRLQVLIDENTMEDLVLIPETSITLSGGEPADISDLLGYLQFDALLKSDYYQNFTFTIGNEGGSPDSVTGSQIVVEGANNDYFIGLSYKSGQKAAPSYPSGTYFSVEDLNGDIVNGTYTVSLSISLPKAYWGLE